jgi:hypothetical protein
MNRPHSGACEICPAKSAPKKFRGSFLLPLQNWATLKTIAPIVQTNVRLIAPAPRSRQKLIWPPGSNADEPSTYGQHVRLAIFAAHRLSQF